MDRLNIKQRMALGLLRQAERMFLKSLGWTVVWEFGEESWLPPKNYFWERKIGVKHNFGHALNSQKSALGNQRAQEDQARHAREREQKMRFEDPLDDDRMME